MRKLDVGRTRRQPALKRNIRERPQAPDDGSPELRALARALVAKRSPSPAYIALMAFINRRTAASKEFFLAHGREPAAGDILRFADIHVTTGMDVFDFWAYVGCRDVVAEGEETVRADGCMVKVEDGRVYRTKTPEEQKSPYCGSRAGWGDVPDTEWMISAFCSPDGRWRRVEEEALSMRPGCHHPTAPIPTIPAVRILGVVDGKHCCRPATQAEFVTDSVDPATSFRAVLPRR